MRTKTILALAASLLLISGCGKEGDNNANKAGEEVGKKVTNFAAGLGQGIDKSLLINVTLTPELEGQGLTKTTAKWSGPEGDKKVITLYLTSKTPIKGTLVAKAFNKEGLEVGRVDRHRFHRR